MGKTAFVLSMARNIAVEHKKPVAVFSLEMSSTQLGTRLIASESGISSEKLRKGELTDAEFTILHQHIARLTNAPIFIDDTPALNIFELRAKCRRLKSQHNVELIIIDYLQLMTSGTEGNRGGNREQEISNISRSIKSIAKELDDSIHELCRFLSFASIRTRSLLLTIGLIYHLEGDRRIAKGLSKFLNGFP